MHRMIPKATYFGLTSDQQLNVLSYRLTDFCICIHISDISTLDNLMFFQEACFISS